MPMGTALLIAAAVVATASALTLILAITGSAALRRKNRKTKAALEKESVAHAVDRLQRSSEEYRGKIEAGTSVFELLKSRDAEVNGKLRAIDVGLNPPAFRFDDDEELKRNIGEARALQLRVILAGSAVGSRSNWTVSDSEAEGEKMTTAYKHLALKAFNDEFEVIRKAMRYSTKDVAQKKLWRLQDQLDKLGEPVGVHLEHSYVSLKEKELEVWHAHLARKEREKQGRKERRALLKAQGGGVDERALDVLSGGIDEKERTLQRAKLLAQQLFDKESDAKAKEIDRLQREIDALRAKQERAISQAQLTRAGYIYVISNIGSFGDGVVKIGLTRRLDPMDRVIELGDASVPFRFDVHTIAFMEDAPSVEKALHRLFDGQRVNTENRRKEFFRVAPQQVEAQLTQLGVESDWYFEVEAREYRESVLMRQVAQHREAALQEQQNQLAELPETI